MSLTEFPGLHSSSESNLIKDNAYGEMDDPVYLYIFYLNEQSLFSPEETSVPLNQSPQATPNFPFVSINIMLNCAFLLN